MESKARLFLKFFVSVFLLSSKGFGTQVHPTWCDHDVLNNKDVRERFLEEVKKLPNRELRTEKHVVCGLTGALPDFL